MKCGRPERRDPPRLSGRKIALIALVAAIAGAGTYRTISLLRWQQESDGLRSIVLDEGQPDQARIDALVILSRNTRRNVDCFREVMARGGLLAQHASNALAALETHLAKK